MANTLAYYDTATITAVKSFIVQAPGFKNSHVFCWKCEELGSWGHIFSHVRPFYERAVSNLDRPMHRSLSLGHSRLAHRWVAHD